ncbi:hypothetical protein SAMN04487831_11261 [Pseudobutyrivibrio sp. UC1225]|uniref:hypothetical protein n=1 Tax=Pseudobutyrivibrio sp. UC1225 TaxID=1798185 RepID=UPI0008E1E140|nr:hypothetical protein [Pseudobutyrivibrio sp. UC1225]SFO21836.1 hypothetical protein SAMN04487831_11261 [Pseudobutyrivibrio sp. UC1225]
MNNVLTRFYRVMLLIFGVGAISLIWTMSVFFNCFISSDDSEITFFCKDNAVVNLLVLLVFIGIMIILKKKSVIDGFIEKLNDDAFYSRLQVIMLRIIACIGLAWVLITQYVPGSDQLDVLSSAYKYGIRDVSVVQADGYLDRWPHNIGIATVERCLAIFVGDYNVVFMQLLNVVGITLIYKKIVETWDKFGGSRFSQVCTLACGIIFYPLIMYASFVYGNIWHVTLALIAFDAEVDYFETHKWTHILKCAVALGLSYMVKSSAVIFFVALVIFAIVKGAMDKTKVYKIFVVILAMFLSLGIFAVVPKMVLSKKMGIELRESTGIWGLIAMGLQEDGSTAGWYNGYPLFVYYANDCDGPASEKAAKEEAFNRIKFLFGDKHNAYEFFSRKIASTWIEPTYQSYWINQVRNHRVNFPKWLDAFMSVKGYVVAAKIFNFFQIIIFAGTILWLIFEDNKFFVLKSFLLLNFVGGFTFLLFWETKSQYTITYFIMLFPYAMNGFELLMDKGVGVAKAANKPITIYAALIVILYMVGYVLDASNCIGMHNETYNNYVETFELPYTGESVRDINIIKAEKESHKDSSEYYYKMLQENGLMP